MAGGFKQRHQSRYSNTSFSSVQYILLNVTGMFAGTIGIRRLLKLFEKNNFKQLVYSRPLPRYLPRRMRSDPRHWARNRSHGYSHENPADMTLEQQRDVLDKTYRMLTEFCGKPPRGSVAPWWETSQEGAELLLSYGIEYDHSMSHDDAQMYWLRNRGYVDEDRLWEEG